MSSDRSGEATRTDEGANNREVSGSGRRGIRMLGTDC